MDVYPKSRIFLYSVFVALQRIWFSCQPLISGAFKLTPRLIKLVMFRTLSQQFRLESASTNGVFGKIVGSPLDVGMFGEYLTTGEFSPKTLNYMLRFFQKNGGKGTFIDIGGHIGLMTIPIARSGDINCITFEPEPKNFRFLKTNISECQVADRVQLINLALFDSAKTIDFEVAEWHHGDHRIRNTDEVSSEVMEYSPFREDTRTIVSVNTIRLDDVINLDDCKSPLVVKIDTQGSEAHVFLGGEETLKKADLVVTEFCPYMIRRMGGDIDGLLTFIEKNFTLGFVSGKHNPTAKIELKDIHQVVEFLRDFTSRVKLDFVDIILSK